MQYYRLPAEHIGGLEQGLGCPLRTGLRRWSTWPSSIVGKVNMSTCYGLDHYGCGHHVMAFLADLPARACHRIRSQD